MEFLKKIILATGLVLPVFHVAYPMQFEQKQNASKKGPSVKSRKKGDFEDNRPDFFEPKFRYKGVRKPQTHKPSTLIKAFNLKGYDSKIIHALSDKILEPLNQKEERDLRIKQAISGLLVVLNPKNNSTVNQLKETFENFLKNIDDLRSTNSNLAEFCEQIRSILGELKDKSGLAIVEVKPAQLVQPQQNPTLWQRHQKKIIIGGCVLGLVVGGVLIAKLGIPAFLFKAAPQVAKKCVDCVATVANKAMELVPVDTAVQPTCPVQEMCQAIPNLLTSGQQVASATAQSGGFFQNFADWFQSVHQSADQQITNFADGLANTHASADSFLGFGK